MPFGSWPLLILLAKSEIRPIYVQHELESRVCRHTNSCETDFASSITSLNLSQFVEGQKRDKKRRTVITIQAENFANLLRYIGLFYPLAFTWVLPDKSIAWKNLYIILALRTTHLPPTTNCDKLSVSLLV